MTVVVYIICALKMKKSDQPKNIAKAFVLLSMHFITKLYQFIVECLHSFIFMKNIHMQVTLDGVVALVS